MSEEKQLVLKLLKMIYNKTVSGEYEWTWNSGYGGERGCYSCKMELGSLSLGGEEYSPFNKMIVYEMSLCYSKEDGDDWNYRSKRKYLKFPRNHLIDDLYHYLHDLNDESLTYLKKFKMELEILAGSENES